MGLKIERLSSPSVTDFTTFSQSSFIFQLGLGKAPVFNFHEVDVEVIVSAFDKPDCLAINHAGLLDISVEPNDTGLQATVELQFNCSPVFEQESSIFSMEFRCAHKQTKKPLADMQVTTGPMKLSTPASVVGIKRSRDHMQRASTAPELDFNIPFPSPDAIDPEPATKVLCKSTDFLDLFFFDDPTFTFETSLD